jgi:crotonobetainyl-CoA:carnitine CoA-transferase CaiB-like acyl-CoA transferase
MSGPLDGIVVVELARTLAGPYCGMLLGDMGANVIKVERPGIGDETRGYAPHLKNGESTYYLSLNRSKRGITVNLKTEEGQKIVKLLVQKADVLIENFRYGVMEKYGLSYDELKKNNPRMVYCAISAFGRTGPMKNEPGYDLLLQGFGGIMSLTGEPDGSPMRVGFSIVDLATGMNACNAILLALYNKEKTGQGQYVEVSLMETIVALQTYYAQALFTLGINPKRCGTAHPSVVPYQAFETNDGFIIIAVATDWQWKNMCDALGLDSLGNDQRFVTNKDRVAHRDRLIPFLMNFMKRRNSSDILTILKKASVPCGMVNDIKQVLEHPQVNLRGMIQEVEHPTIGALRMLGIPIKLSTTPGSIRIPPPSLGQHNNEVLLGLGYTEDDISRFRAEGVI